MCSFGISTKYDELDHPSLYWIFKLHGCPYKQCYIVGSAKCSTSLWSNYWHLFYQRSKPGFSVTVAEETYGMVWIRCGFWEKGQYFYNQGLSPHAISFEFSTLYTSNHHSKLKNVVKLHLFTFLVQCCIVRCYCRVKTMFSSSLLPFEL